MKRFLVSDGQGQPIKLYYISIDIAKASYPNAEIVEINDDTHIPFIEDIIRNSKKLAEFHRSNNKNDMRELYLYKSDMGEFKVCLFRDARDNHYYDHVEYIHYKPHAHVVPITRTITTPQLFCEEYIYRAPFAFEIISKTRCPGVKETLPKPTELKGIKQYGSVTRLKCKNPVFFKGDALYIKCNDYFSPSRRTAAEDVGTPLSYRAQKYYGQTVSEKFIYPDSWGDIVLRIRAWLKFSGFKTLLLHFDNVQIAEMCCDKIRAYHRFPDALDVSWHAMFEEISNIGRQWLNQ